MRRLRGLLVGNEDFVKVSLNEVVRGGQRLAVFAEVISAPSLRLEFEPTKDTPAIIDSLIFYSFTEIGNFLFFGLYDSKLAREIYVGSRRQLDFGSPKLIDSYVIEDPTEQQRIQMQADYHRYLESRERTADPVGVGELFTFNQAVKAESRVV